VLLSDNVQDFSRTVMLRTEDSDRKILDQYYLELERRGVASLREEGFGPKHSRLERWVDMRYRGQSFEISIPYSRDFPGEFHRRHQQRYGYADPGRESEIVTLRVRARGFSEKPKVPKHRSGGADPKRAEIKRKKIYFEGKLCPSRVYERALLRAGNRVPGPALIFEYSASTAIPPGYGCAVDGYRNLILEPL
jgi:N-methylhydantoinase A